MPFGDGTGPRGMGMMTGRGTGYCNASYSPGYVNQVSLFGPGPGIGRERMTGGGRGIGRGRGAGRGRGFGRYFSRGNANTRYYTYFNNPRGVYPGYNRFPY